MHAHVHKDRVQWRHQQRLRHRWRAAGTSYSVSYTDTPIIHSPKSLIVFYEYLLCIIFSDTVWSINTLFTKKKITDEFTRSLFIVLFCIYKSIHTKCRRGSPTVFFWCIWTMQFIFAVSVFCRCFQLLYSVGFILVCGDIDTHHCDAS